jgi:hypothetical protein
MRVRKLALRRFPKNAYETLANDCALILEEPKRYFQNDWLFHGEARIQYMVDKYRGLVCPDFRDGPSCGTVACVAGWTTTQHGCAGQDDQNLYTAFKLLGTTNYHMMFYENDPFAFSLRKLFGYDLPPNYYNDFKVGSREYAEWGVQRIQAFMDRFEDRLKRTTYTYAGRGANRKVVTVHCPDGRVIRMDE